LSETAETQIEDPPAPEDRGRLGDREAWLLLLLLLLAFNAAKLAFVAYSVSDENIYFQMGKLVADGKLPYRDFRFAHPPVKLLPPALLFLFTGFSFTALKLLPVLATNLTALFLFLTLRRSVSAFVAVIGVAVFLFSFPGLYYTSYYMGTNLTLTFLVISFFFLARRGDFVAGLFFGIAFMTGVYAVCGIAAAGAYLLFTERSRLPRIIAGGLVVFVIGNVAGLVLGGSEFLRHVYLFHFLKSGDPTSPKSEMLLRVVLANPALLAGAALYPFFRRRETNPLWLAGVVTLAFVALYASVHDYYFVLAAPFLATAAAITFTGTIAKLRLSAVAGAMVACLGVGLLGALHLEPARRSIEHSAVPAVEEMAAIVTEAAPPEATIFGTAEVAPLVALISHRPILFNHVDSNAKTYLTGVAKLDRVIAHLAGGHPVAVFTKERVASEEGSIHYGAMVDPAFREFVLGRGRHVKTWVNADTPDERLHLIAFGW